MLLRTLQHFYYLFFMLLNSLTVVKQLNDSREISQYHLDLQHIQLKNQRNHFYPSIRIVTQSNIKIFYIWQQYNHLIINKVLKLMNSAVAYNQKFQIFPSQNDSNIKFPKNNLERPQNRDSLKTFSTVLDQALTTKDKNSIKEILINQDQEIIVNTISNLSLKCILPLLEHIQILLLQDHSNAIKYLSWLAQTVKIHLGIIVNSIESRNKLKSIKKIINERLSNENKIMMMYGKLPLQTKKTRQNKQFKPKFHYIEEEQDADEYHEGEQQKQAYFNEQQELDFEDFDEMDQFI